MASDKFLSSCSIHVIDSNVIRARMNIYEKQTRKYGGKFIWKPSADEGVTHLLVDDDLSGEAVAKIISSRFSKLRNGRQSETKLLRTKWLSACLKEKKLVATTPYEVHLPERSEEKAEERREISTRPHQQRKRHSSTESQSKGIYDQTTDEDSSGESRVHSSQSTRHDTSYDSDASTSSQPKKRRVEIETPRSGTDGQINHNQLITDKLNILAEGYKSTNDKWRALAYEKAIRTLSRYPKPISSYEEVRSLRGIGQRLAEKIWEIHESGTLRKAEEFLQSDRVRTMNLFTNIFGVGPTIAEHWFAQGLRTLKDVEEKANLTWQQRLGVKYYDEINSRMDRSEAMEIVETVVNSVREMDPSLIITAGGSFRRGCQTCGDVDFILTHSDGQSHENALAPLVKKLTDSGFLTDHLVECDVDESQRKYMGLCKLPGENHLRRRIDIIAVPYSEYATSVIYFTGSVYFVRSIYSKAKRMGMRLNHHGLYGGVMRQGGEKLNEGYLIPTPTEESVFEKLGVRYRTPEERDFVSFTEDL